jgi:hypothetical protein
MISTERELACSVSQARISGERPNRRGPNPKGKAFTNRGGDAIGVQSSTASVTSCPSAMSDSQRRTTEYDGPVASSEIAGTVWINRMFIVF